jgi:hypothetical protein
MSEGVSSRGRRGHRAGRPAAARAPLPGRRDRAFRLRALGRAQLAERDVTASAGEASPADGFAFSAEYKSLRRQVFFVNLGVNVLVLLTIYFMTAQTGA